MSISDLLLQLQIVGPLAQLALKFTHTSLIDCLLHCIAAAGGMQNAAGGPHHS